MTHHSTSHKEVYHRSSSVHDHITVHHIKSISQMTHHRTTMTDHKCNHNNHKYNIEKYFLSRWGALGDLK